MCSDNVFTSNQDHQLKQHRILHQSSVLPVSTLQDHFVKVWIWRLSGLKFRIGGSVDVVTRTVNLFIGVGITTRLVIRVLKLWAVVFQLVIPVCTNLMGLITGDGHLGCCAWLMVPLIYGTFLTISKHKIKPVKGKTSSY